MPVSNIVHPLEPIFDENSRVLILGTMPSPKSREAGIYYGHPKNRFWPAMSVIFGEDLISADNDARRSFLLRRGIAMWDVLKSCDISGASDASIKNAAPNDLGIILRIADIRAVFCTGKKSAELYNKYCFGKMTDIAAVTLPSTSPANCAVKNDEIYTAYSVIRKYLD